MTPRITIATILWRTKEMEYIRTKDYKTYHDNVVSRINFLDDNDDTYMQDLEVVLPKMFARSMYVDPDGSADGYARPGDTVYLLDLCYEGKGTLREYYPHWFEQTEKDK